MENKIAVGTLVQWYEVEILDEYLESLSKAESSNEVLFDFTVYTGQQLEKYDGDDFKEIENKIQDIFLKYPSLNINLTTTNELTSIADYRRQFNTNYCNKVDILMWGETDMLMPEDGFLYMDMLHSSQSETTPKYIATFAICKMWDESWKQLEHPLFAVKPFIENDYTNWWSLKYTMTLNEMNVINEQGLANEIIVLPKNKFNGCGLVISSEVIKSGVNIPESVFFVHEDTAFLKMIERMYDTLPQYHFKNILLVHNRNHPKKRMFIANESGDTMNQKRRSNDWYIKANKYSEENCYNMFNPNHKPKTWADVWK
jgi:hypothetical protein